MEKSITIRNPRISESVKLYTCYYVFTLNGLLHTDIHEKNRWLLFPDFIFFNKNSEKSIKSVVLLWNKKCIKLCTFSVLSIFYLTTPFINGSRWKIMVGNSSEGLLHYIEQCCAQRDTSKVYHSILSNVVLYETLRRFITLYWAMLCYETLQGHQLDIILSIF